MSNTPRFAIVMIGLALAAILGLAIGFYWPIASIKDDTKDSIAQAKSIERGKDLAIFGCSGCHNLEASGKSPNKAAPPFRTLVKRLSQEGLQEQLEVALSMGHAPMPPWNINPVQSEDLLSFIESLRQAKNN